MKIFYFTILTIVFFSFNSYSQHSDSTEKYTLENVEVVAKKRNNQLLNLNSSSISQQMLLESFSNSFAQALEKLPGISTINTGVGISKPVIRGLSTNRIIVTDFNIKQEGQQWGLDHGLEIDAFNADKVEILKGPVSLIHGSDGIGGVINISNADPHLDEILRIQTITYYKSNNHSIGGSIKIEKNWGPIYLRIVNSAQKFSAYRVPADSFIYNSYVLPLYNGILKNTAGNEWSNSFSIGIKKENFTHQLTFTNFQQKTGLFIGAIGIPRSYNLQPNENNRSIDIPYQKVQHYKFITNHQWRNNFGLFKMDFAFQLNNRKEIAKPHPHNGVKPIGNTSLHLNLKTFSSNFSHTKYLHPFTIQSGWQFQHQINMVKGFEFLIPNYQQTQIGFYTHTKTKINPKTTASGGIRWDYIQQNIKEGNLQWLNEEGEEIFFQKRSEALNRQYSNLTAGIGISYELTRKLNLNFNIGSAFRTPTISELSANGIHHGTFRHEMGSQSLNQEKGWLFDLQVRQKIRNGFLELSPFYNHFNNYIYLKPSGRFSNLPEAGQIYQYIDAPVTFLGTEFWMQQSFLTNWEYNIIAEYVWNENSQTKSPLPFTPPLNVLTEIVYRAPKISKKINWKASVNSQYFAAQNRTDINEPNTPSYLLANASLDGDMTIGNNKISILLQAKNLLNTHYLNNMSRYRILNLPEQGINFQIIIRYQF